MGEILLKKNIITDCKPMKKEDVIKKLGDILYQSGYVTEKYTEAMIEKEKVFNTAIGNALAIPHGIESMTGEILDSGIAVMAFPNGQDWGDDNTVKLVIALAANGDDHMDIMTNIVINCSDEEETSRIAAMSAQEIYDIFS